jgi:hypothetical protein
MKRQPINRFRKLMLDTKHWLSKFRRWSLWHFLIRDRRSLCESQIETLLGFTQEEWLNDPVRWYQQIHPDDKARWSVEAAELVFAWTSVEIALPSCCSKWQRRLVSL